jgi:hypothetical protein
MFSVENNAFSHKNAISKNIRRKPNYLPNPGLIIKTQIINYVKKLYKTIKTIHKEMLGKTEHYLAVIRVLYKDNLIPEHCRDLRTNHIPNPECKCIYDVVNHLLIDIIQKYIKKASNASFSITLFCWI